MLYIFLAQASRQDDSYAVAGDIMDSKVKIV